MPSCDNCKDKEHYWSTNHRKGAYLWTKIKELCSDWKSIMRPTPATYEERREYLSNMSKPWHQVAWKFRHEPNFDIVMQVPQSNIWGHGWDMH